jgi:hypothetical protein
MVIIYKSSITFARWTQPSWNLGQFLKYGARISACHTSIGLFIYLVLLPQKYFQLFFKTNPIEVCALLADLRQCPHQDLFRRQRGRLGRDEFKPKIGQQQSL